MALRWATRAMLAITMAPSIVLGCTSNTIVPEYDSTGVTDPSETDAPSTTADGTITVPPDATGFDSTAGSTTIPASTDDTTTGRPDMCAFPSPEAIACGGPGMGTLIFDVNAGGTPLRNLPLEETCTIMIAVGSFLELTCASQPVSIIVFEPSPTFPWAPGTPVDLTYWEDFEDEANVARFVTVRHAEGGELLFAAFEASTLPDPVQADLSPLSLSLLPTTCPTFQTECVEAQDAVLRVEYGGETVDLFTGQEAFAGALTSYRVVTGQVERIHCFPDDCGYSYAEWLVQAAFFQIPEG